MRFLSILSLFATKTTLPQLEFEIINLVLLLPGPRGKRNKINKIYCC